MSPSSANWQRIGLFCFNTICMRTIPDFIFCLSFALLSVAGLYFFQDAKWILPTSLIATCALALLFKISLVQQRYDFSDFFKGENNTYSLSRLQFFIWVLIIISSQIAAITILVKEHAIERYRLVIGEHMLWILAASFGTLLSVQGIASQKKRSQSLKMHSGKDLKDLIVEDGKLDFTRFQMLLWTVIAFAVYYFQTVSYLNDVRTTLIAEGKVQTKTELLQKLNSKVLTISDKVEIAASMPGKMKQDSIASWNYAIIGDLKNLNSKGAVDSKALSLLIFQSNSLPDSLTIDVERVFIKTVLAKCSELLTIAANELTLIESKMAAAFSESETVASTVPDISITFLILMGLVQGAYVGKKLLPVDSSGQPTTTLPGTFTPATAEGQRAFDDLKLKEALEIAKMKYLPKDYVTGVDIGLKEIKGKTTGAKVLRIHVSKKIVDINQLDESVRIPAEINGVPTDVIESNFTEQNSGAGNDRKTRVDPLQPGVSVGSDHATGTLGLIVIDTLTGDKCILSNDHVLNSDTAYQPGLRDGGSKQRDKVGESLRSIRTIKGDAALFKITDTTRKIDQEIFGTKTTLTNAKLPTSKMILKKSGKETGVTEGIVTSDIGVYKIQNSDYAVNGFLVSPNSDRGPITIAGDSGSVWFDESTSEGVGLHIGISQDGKALACLLTDVLSELKAKI
jgi:hypothetical protein